VYIGILITYNSCYYASSMSRERRYVPGIIWHYGTMNQRDEKKKRSAHRKIDDTLAR